MTTALPTAPAYSDVPFEDRDRTEFWQGVQGHYALMEGYDTYTLVRIVDIVSNECGHYRKLEVEYNHPFGRYLGMPRTPLDRVEVREDRLIPVDITAEHWWEKAMTWKAGQRQKALDEALPSPVKTPPSSPRF